MIYRAAHPGVVLGPRLLAEPGLPLTVLVGDETARENISRLAASQGYAVRVETTEGGFALKLSPGEKPAEAAGPVVQGKTVAFVSSDAMGSGSDELGRLLLKNFLFTLGELETIPDTLLFVNAGVKLTTEGSEALEALERLACMGADIASCGLCLDYYHLKEKLAVGRVTNMLDIAEILALLGCRPVWDDASRRVTGFEIIGLEELTRYGLIWLTLIAIPIVVVDGGQIRMGEFVNRAPERLRAGLARLTALVSAAVLLGVVWSVLRSVAQNVGSVTPTLGIPYWLFILPALLGFAAGALAYVLLALGVLRVRDDTVPPLG